MIVSIIVAMTRSGVIGNAGKLPWHLPEDLKRFKELTLGHTVIMGRKTWESLGCKPLARRSNVVLTRDPHYPSDIRRGVFVPPSLGVALSSARCVGLDEVFIIGGAQVYAQALPVADRLYITWVDIDLEPTGDTHFPAFDLTKWRQISSVSGDRCEYAVYEKSRG